MTAISSPLEVTLCEWRLRVLGERACNPASALDKSFCQWADSPVLKGDNPDRRPLRRQLDRQYFQGKLFGIELHHGAGHQCDESSGRD